MLETASLVYDPETYDDFPTYEWNARFNIDDFARIIEEHNDDLWAHMKLAICGKLGIPFRMGGCKWKLLLRNPRLSWFPYQFCSSLLRLRPQCYGTWFS